MSTRTYDGDIIRIHGGGYVTTLRTTGTGEVWIETNSTAGELSFGEYYHSLENAWEELLHHRAFALAYPKWK